MTTILSSTTFRCRPQATAPYRPLGFSSRRCLLHPPYGQTLRGRASCGAAAHDEKLPLTSVRVERVGASLPRRIARDGPSTGGWQAHGRLKESGRASIVGGMPDAAQDLRRLGEARSGTPTRSSPGCSAAPRSRATLDALVEDSFARVGSASTIAVARWMAGDGEEVAREVGRESWRIFGQLAAQRARR